MFTIFYGTFYNMLEATALGTYIPDISEQPMYESVMYIYGQVGAYFSSGTTMNCQMIGFYMGQYIAESLSTYVETTVPLVQIQGI